MSPFSAGRGGRSPLIAGGSVVFWAFIAPNAISSDHVFYFRCNRPDLDHGLAIPGELAAPVLQLFEPVKVRLTLVPGSRFVRGG